MARDLKKLHLDPAKEKANSIAIREQAHSGGKIQQKALSHKMQPNPSCSIHIPCLKILHKLRGPHHKLAPIENARPEHNGSLRIDPSPASEDHIRRLYRKLVLRPPITNNRPGIKDPRVQQANGKGN